MFPLIRAIVTLPVYLLIAPRVSLSRIRRPLLIGLIAQGLGLASLLAFLPMAAAATWAVFFSAACDAFALAMIGPLTESLMSVNIPGEERARINSLIFAGILLVSTPAGWIAGQIAERSSNGNEPLPGGGGNRRGMENRPHDAARSGRNGLSRSADLDRPVPSPIMEENGESINKHLALK